MTGGLLVGVLFFLILAIQGSVLSLAGAGVTPDILLTVVVALALFTGWKKGAFIGFCAGFLQDIIFGAPLGFFAAGKLLAGFLAGIIGQEIYRDSWLSPMIVVAFITFISEILTYFTALIFLSTSVSLLGYLLNTVLPRVAMHFFITGVIYPVIYKLLQRRLLFLETESDG